MIRIEHLAKTFADGNAVLKDVNCVIRDGDVISVIGPSGTGKSTFLRCLNLLDPPTGGKIFFNDEEITAAGYPAINVHRRVSMVFQSFNLFEHLSVIENIMLPQVSVLKRSCQEAYDIGIRLLASVGMEQKALVYPSSLSGGQKQRAAIARTLAMQPEIILFDEPTSALDPTMVDEVHSVIRNVAASGTTVLIVTHDMELAKSICTRVFYMDQGIIYEDGTPEQIFEHPQKERTRQFVRRIRNFETEFTEQTFDYQQLFSSIFAYGLKTHMPSERICDMQLVTEELVCTLLFQQLEENSRIGLLYEYSGLETQTSLTMRYGGKRFELFPAQDADGAGDTDDPLAISRSLVRNLATELTYSYDASQELPNELKLILRRGSRDTGKVRGETSSDALPM